ncbi:MAG: SDR family oxidoreductase [Bacteroidota bacterium]
MFRLDQKVAIVTGGGSGIGEAICKLYARQGAKVHLLDIDTEGAAAVAAAIKAEGGMVETHYCDLSQQENVKRTFTAIWDQAGKIDILVNNAAIAHIGTAETTTEEELDRIYQINIKGVYNGIHVALPYLKQSGGGVILNLASVISAVGIKDRFAYGMSKGAVWTMTLSVAKDYLADGIRCNALAPARVHTPFVDGFLQDNYPGQESEMFDKLSQTQPIGRMGKPEEIAGLAVYLASDEASFITGSLFPIDGGFITLNN